VELPSSDASYLRNPTPVYPPSSKRLGEQGQVLVRVLIGADGVPQRAEIKRSSGFPRLDQSAEEYVMKSRYVPGKVGRRAASDVVRGARELRSGMMYFRKQRTMDSQFGLSNLWAQGDFVTRGTALVLLAMSLATWVVIVAKALDLRRFTAQSRRVEAFWRGADFNEGLKLLGGEAVNPFRALAAKVAKPRRTTMRNRSCTTP
jgi:TonB family protein